MATNTSTTFTMQMTARGLNLSGCRVTPENVEHPLLQEFFNSIGASAIDNGKGYVQVRGNMNINNADLCNFLLKRGVDLNANPNSLDTKPEVAQVPLESPFKFELPELPQRGLTPSYNQSKTNPKVPNESTNITPPEEEVKPEDQDNSWYNYLKPW